MKKLRVVLGVCALGAGLAACEAAVPLVEPTQRTRTPGEAGRLAAQLSGTGVAGSHGADSTAFEAGTGVGSGH